MKTSLQTLTKEVTTIVIAHRLSTVLEADTIMVVQEGEVIEQGCLDELLEKKGGFRRLFDQQFKARSSDAVEA